MTGLGLIKSVTIEKMDEAGTGRARIAQLAAIDSDGDTYAPGAFTWKEGGGQWVQMIPAHDRRSMPFGKAWLHEENGWAVADFTLNLASQAGKEWHAALSFDLSKGQPVQQWSYGFNILDAGYEQREGNRIRVLKRLDCDEISPVLRGAGVGTGTLSIKALKNAAFAPLITQLGELAEALTGDASALSATGRKQLADIHVAIGKALTPEADVSAQELAATDAVLGDYLKGIARSHIKG